MICYCSNYTPIGWQVGTGRFTPPYVILGGTRGIEMEIVLHMFMHGFMVMWMVCHWLMLSIFPASQPIQSCGATASIESKPVRLSMDWREGTGWVRTCWSAPISSFWCWNLQFWLSFSWRNTSWEESQGASACFYAVPSLLSESMAISRSACVFICKYTNLRIHPQTLHNPTYIYIYNYICIYIYIYIYT